MRLDRNGIIVQRKQQETTTKKRRQDRRQSCKFTWQTVLTSLNKRKETNLILQH